MPLVPLNGLKLKPACFNGIVQKEKKQSTPYQGSRSPAISPAKDNQQKTLRGEESNIDYHILMRINMIRPQF